ncbi:hypothetical protein D3C73_1542200 [compost metagenome]
MSAPDIGMAQQPFNNRMLCRPVDVNGPDHIDGMKMDSQLIGAVGDTVLNGPGGKGQEYFPGHKPVPHHGSALVNVRYNPPLFQ